MAGRRMRIRWARVLHVLLLASFCILLPAPGIGQDAEELSVDEAGSNGLTLVRKAKAPVLLFHESCEDVLFMQRGWYDNNSLRISVDEHVPGSAASLEYRFLKGATTPTSGGGVRRLFTPSQTVYVSYWVKYSANWEGSNRPYHPHEFHFITDVDDKWIGPAATHLTTYIEHNEGRPLLSMQDALNIDEANIGRNLAGITENRAVAGCNGSSDAWPEGDCYLSGSTHRNGKVWKSASIIFSDTPGPLYKNSWRFVEALFALNSIVDGKGVADGELRMWVDGSIVVDAAGVMLRTGQHAAMRFNQFLNAPYIGDGSPVEQTMWVDEIVFATGRTAVLARPDLRAPMHRATVTAGDQLVSWTPVAGAAVYSIERADDSLFSAGVVITMLTGDTTLLYSGLPAGTQVWWRVRAENPAGEGEWSDARMFHVQSSTGVQRNHVPRDVTARIAPHPVTATATIFADIPDAGRTTVLLFDALGRRVRVLVDAVLQMGENPIRFDASDLPAGVYFIRISSARGIVSTPILVQH